MATARGTQSILELLYNLPNTFLSVAGNPDLKQFRTRLKIWKTESEHCDGLWLRFICNLGTGDLYRVQTATEMFVNKLKLEYDPIGFHCIEQWFHNKTTGVTDKNSFDINFYKKLPWVKNHV